MGNSTNGITMDEVAGNSGTPIEIKIKTMDSQTYTMRVDKQMSVPALKEQIASVTGIVTEHQRLICRGKVLKDDQLLSAYHVEDGHTLHLVVRDPASATSNLPNDPASGSSNGDQGQYFHVAPGIIVETLNIPRQGDGALSNIVSAILGSIGASVPSTGGEALGARVIPDAVTTLSEYLSHMKREFIAGGRMNENNTESAATHGAEGRDFNSVSSAGSTQQGLPTTSSLAQLLLSTRQMLNQQTGDCLQQLATQLENQGTVEDPGVRSSTQSNAWRAGVLLQNLGAYLLELGRTTMTVRLGGAPSEAVVNAGPAVFISSSGPNPIMVQPLPFQPGASFGAPSEGASQPGSSLRGPGFGAGGVRRVIDIEIRRSSSAHQLESDSSEQQAGRSNLSTETNRDHASADSQNAPAAATSGRLRGATVHVVPVRSMVASIPDLNGSPLDLSGNSSGSYHPLFGRYQNVTTMNLGSRRTVSQVSGENQPFVFQAELQATPESAVQQGNMEDSIEDGQGDGVTTRTIDIDILSTSGLNDQNAEGQIANGVMQLLRGLLGVENVNSAGMAGESSTDQGRTDRTATQEEEPMVTEEGIFLSSLLHQIMPFISSEGQESNVSPGEAGSSDPASENLDGRDSGIQGESSGTGTARRQADAEPDIPNPKRQKTE